MPADAQACTVDLILLVVLGWCTLTDMFWSGGISYHAESFDTGLFDSIHHLNHNSIWHVAVGA